MNPERFYRVVIALLLTTLVINVSLIIACATAYRFLMITFVTDSFWLAFAIFIAVFVVMGVVIYRGISRRLDGRIVIEILARKEKKDTHVA